jgi:hypothetical protein
LSTTFFVFCKNSFKTAKARKTGLSGKYRQNQLQ